MPSNARAEGMLEAFDHLGYGAILVDRDGQVIELNDEARSHLGLSFQIVRGRLTASDRTAKERLEDLLARMSTRGERIPTSETGAVALPRPKGRPLVAYISPIPNALRETLGARAGMILLVDPDTDREPARALLQQAFALTPAETRLAVGLVQGHDLQSIAHLHGVSIGTPRSLEVDLRENRHQATGSAPEPPLQDVVATEVAADRCRVPRRLRVRCLRRPIDTM